MVFNVLHLVPTTILDSVIVVRLIIILTLCLSTGTCILMPYGHEACDTQITSVGDDTTHPITLSSSFQFFGDTKSSLSVCSNGFIDFMGSISFGGNFPHSAGMMALLWMDLTPRNVGRLYYRETSENPETFAVAAKLVQEILGISIVPTYAFIVTWERFGIFGTDASNEVTAQLAIVTDNTLSFAIFLYNPFSIVAPTGYNPTIGVNVGDNVRFTWVCHTSWENNLHEGRQSLCQAEPGAFAIRIDTYQDGACISPITPAASVCGIDGDCTESHCPLCSLATSGCVECLTDTDCSDAEKPYCFQGLCGPCTDDVCGNTVLPVCLPILGCIECLEGSHCPAQSLCDRETQTCVPACDPPCADFQTCMNPYLCDVRNNPGTCTPECLVHEHCSDPTLPFCLRTRQTCSDTECLSHDDCYSASRPYCDFEFHRCAECLRSDDCYNGKICNGQCVCPADNDPCNNRGEACDANGYCACISGFIRDNSRTCVRDCYPPCDEGQICTRELMCICEPGTVFTSSEQCAACILECQTDADCRNEGETCDSEKKCKCSVNEKLFMGKCRKRGELGGLCHDDGRCWGRAVRCNLLTFTCECGNRFQAANFCKEK